MKPLFCTKIKTKMKKAALSLLLASPLLAFCQKKDSWFVRPYGSVAGGKEYFFNKNTADGWFPEAKRVMGAGVDVGRSFGQFYASAGLGWVQTGSVKNVIFATPISSGYSYNHVAAIKTQHQHSYLSIAAGCNVGWFFVQGNVMPSYHYTGWSRAYDTKPEYGAPDWDEDPLYEQALEEWKPYWNRWNLLIGATSGLNIPVSKKVAIQVAGDLKYSLFSLYKADGDTKYLNLGGLLGVLYKFK